MKRFQAELANARTKDSMRALAKLCRTVDGELRIVGNPPLVTPIEDVLPGAEQEHLEDIVRRMIRTYRRTLPRDRRQLLESYRYVHAARKVVGVGSVGTRAWILLLLGRDETDPLFLQFKEAQPSVLEPFLGRASSPARAAGRRGAADDAGRARHPARLGAHRRDRRRDEGLLHPAALGREGLGRGRADGSSGARRLRADLRLDARARPRPLR